MDLGRKLRRFRTQRRMTLQELSDKSTVSKSLLSEVERNLAVPTVLTLKRITDALNITLSTLFSGTANSDPVVLKNKNATDGKDFTLVRKEDRKKLIMPWGADYEMLCPDFQHKIEFILVHYPVGSKIADSYSHEGEECGLVLKGKFRGIIGDHEVILETGDSIYYNSSVPHRWENAGGTDVMAIWAITPPSL